jgi:hypothetical protein
MMEAWPSQPGFPRPKQWTRDLGLPVVEAWRPWTVDGQALMGGYVTTYAGGGPQGHNFTFLTVRGAGHMVPQFKPVRWRGVVFALFHLFLYRLCTICVLAQTWLWLVREGFEGRCALRQAEALEMITRYLGNEAYQYFNGSALQPPY